MANIWGRRYRCFHRSRISSPALSRIRGYKSSRTRIVLATAALLTRVATVDSELSEARREKLHAVLKSCFGLDDLATAQLIRDAAAAVRSAVDLYHFTRRLSTVLDNEGRQRVVKMMWQVVYADEHVNEFESNIIWRTADLLGVSSRQRIELRQRVASDRTALNPA
jgi:Uncharacterized protein conserved in bacteria